MVTDDPTVGDGERSPGAREPGEADEENDRENKGTDKEPWRPGEQPYAETAEQGGQPNLGPRGR